MTKVAGGSGAEQCREVKRHMNLSNLRDPWILLLANAWLFTLPPASCLVVRSANWHRSANIGANEMVSGRRGHTYITASEDENKQDQVIQVCLFFAVLNLIMD